MCVQSKVPQLSVANAQLQKSALSNCGTDKL